MAFLLWIYLSGCVVIFGACLCASEAETFGQCVPSMQTTGYQCPD
jgi:uncharacterized BrkB/YihY/UPF0761 family membrane protein